MARIRPRSENSKVPTDMKPILAKGVTATKRYTVDKDRTIDFMGDDLRVYATPQIVHDLEYACRNLILEHLDEGEDTVGAKIEIWDRSRFEESLTQSNARYPDMARSVAEKLGM